jgi:hypothetical protein
LSPVKHRFDFLRVTDIVERIGIQQDQISEPPGFNSAQLIFSAQEARRIQGSCLKRFHGREAGLDQQSKLVVQAESRKAKWIQGIGARQNPHPRSLHQAHHCKISLKLSSGNGEVVRCFAIKVCRIPAGPHCPRHVFQPPVISNRWIVPVAQYPQQRQRWALPRPIAP